MSETKPLTDYQHGYIAALRMFAVWHNGEQIVGCGWKTLKQASAEFLAEPIEAIDLHEPDLLQACKRALPWIGKLIADGGHEKSVMPDDAIRTMQMLDAAIGNTEETK